LLDYYPASIGGSGGSVGIALIHGLANFHGHIGNISVATSPGALPAADVHWQFIAVGFASTSVTGGKYCDGTIIM
jgi:hypothetical protein